MSETIFGYSWEEIQSRQQGTYKSKTINGPIVKPQATDEDIAMLKQFGLEGLKEKQFFGVIGRLETSGLI